PGPGSFFRAPVAAVEHALPAPGATPGKPVVDPGSQMLRPLPLSPAEPYVGAAEQQLKAHNLTNPPGNNAYDNVVAGWKADRSHLRLPAVTAGLFAALGDEAERRLRAGDDKRARDYMQRAGELAKLAPGDATSMARLHERATGALQARVDQAAARLDRAAAIRTVDAARTLGLDATAIASLQARAQRVPQPGAVAPYDGLRLSRIGDRMLAAAESDVSRGDYARFASATGRPATLCRERTSLLRLLAPRSWKSPGFEQSPQHPVVCVSWNDADAYARWLSQHTGRRYRLPTAAEAHALPGTGGAKPVAEWLSDCSQGCKQRLATGRSWRGASGSRPLDATRGYDDVGFRLVRDP
ncbi:MAG: formylglycine-generating enzyme family protein, partial [Luteimonas sp.]